MLALAGCGSLAADELPAPAGPPVSPPLTQRPAGEVERPAAASGTVVRDGAREYSVDPRANRLRLRVDGREVAATRTGAEPTQVRLLDRGAKVAVLCTRERVLELYDARTLKRLGKAGAGIGPTSLTTDGVEILYVTDVLGDALLVFHLRPRFELVRRVHVIGGPYAIAFDRERWGLWLALPGANKLANFAAGSRPVWRATVPSIRNARVVSVGADEVTVYGEDARQVVRLRSR